VAAWLARISARPVRLVVLRPSVAVVARRDADRRERIGKVAYRGDFTPTLNDRAVGNIPCDLALLPVRQWVLSFPRPLRMLFASRPEALSRCLAVITRAIQTGVDPLSRTPSLLRIRCP
jgi:hypothetical protein